MSISFFIALASALIGSASAAAILAQDSRHSVNRLAGLLIAGVTLWGTCDILRLLAPDAGWALTFARLSTPGWAFIGPLSVHLVISTQLGPAQRLRWILPWAYAASGALLAVAWFTPWMYGTPVATPSGWSVPPGPGVVAALVVTLVVVLPVAGIGLSAIRTSGSPSDRAQLLWLAAGVSLPLVLIPSTNVLLPTLGHPTVRMGSLAFALFGAIVAATTLRWGNSPLSRGAFARKIVDAHPDGMALVMLNGVIGSASEGLGHLVGRSAAELEGVPLESLLGVSLVRPPSEVQDLEEHLATADGRRIPVSVSTRLLPDRRGLPFALLVVIRDLREVVSLRSRLVTSGRLAAMGQLAAGIAHEINNPMAFVRTNLSLLRQHWERLAKEPPSEDERERILAEGDELLAESLEGVARACTIVRDINNFSHAGSGEHVPVDLHALLENVIRVASPHLGGDLVLEREFRPVPHALGASQELKQLFLNLVLNACHATDGRGRIRIRTESDARDRVVVHVEDDGCGIPPEAREKIFDPFFTTKPVGEGTGMGLFISYQIVRNHGGDIAVQSTPGAGTSVAVTLPAAPA